MRRAAGALLGVAAAVLLTACAHGTGHASGQSRATAGPSASAEPAAARVPGWRVPPGQFVSLRFAPAGQQSPGPMGFLEVALGDVRTGAVVRRLLPASAGGGMQVSGLALDRAGDLWVTYSKGPAYGGDVAGGDPRPDTCANEIDEVQAGTGRVTVFLRTGDNVLLSGARPSPDGTRLVYIESACVAYYDAYLRVTDLGSGRSWTIGQNLPRCHLLTSPAWSVNGRELLVSYGPPGQSGYSGPQGTCPVWSAGRLVRLDALTGQAGLAGTTVRADPGCQITSVASDAGGVLAIEGCGTAPEYTSGPARLLVLSASSHPVGRLSLGKCADGSELAVNQAGTDTLISAYLYCNPPGHPGPVTRLWEYRGGTLRLITSIPGDTSGARMMAWLS
jgi:hypothetical protein